MRGILNPEGKRNTDEAIITESVIIDAAALWTARDSAPPPAPAIDLESRTVTMPTPQNSAPRKHATSIICPFSNRLAHNIF